MRRRQGRNAELQGAPAIVANAGQACSGAALLGGRAFRGLRGCGCRRYGRRGLLGCGGHLFGQGLPLLFRTEADEEIRGKVPEAVREGTDDARRDRTAGHVVLSALPIRAAAEQQFRRGLSATRGFKGPANMRNEPPVPASGEQVFRSVQARSCDTIEVTPQLTNT